MDVRLHVLDQGTGDPPVVLTHGWADDASVWGDVAGDLAADHRVVTWDLRGHGASEVPPPGEYSREHALGDLARVVAQAGAPVVLGGHSLGGYLSLAYALRHPEQVAGLVLVAAGPGFRNPDAMAQWNESVRVSAPKLAIPPGQEEISIHTDSWVIDHLGDITAPVLVVVGERDKRFVASAEVFGKYLDVRATVIVPDGGHAVHRKHAPEVAKAIRDFTAQL
jgi:pimeloyl-ACP methyl ester carboxylesterase